MRHSHGRRSDQGAAEARARGLWSAAIQLQVAQVCHFKLMVSTP